MRLTLPTEDSRTNPSRSLLTFLAEYLATAKVQFLSFEYLIIVVHVKDFPSSWTQAAHKRFAHRLGISEPIDAHIIPSLSGFRMKHYGSACHPIRKAD